MTNVVNVGYHSTNYYVLDIQDGCLLVDCGWPRTLPQFTAQLKRKGISASEIRYILATHFHPDHAGLVEEFKALGAKLVLMESQLDALHQAPADVLPKIPTFVTVSPQNNGELKFTESRQFLSGLGLAGEILPTPGHSDDSVSLLLDEGFAFTGDLPRRFAVAEDNEIARASWDRIYRQHITQIFPAHGSQFPAD